VPACQFGKKGAYLGAGFFLPLHEARVMGKSPGHKGNKQELPQKICATCEKPFTWRKKWARNWEEVKYCSERCRRNRVA